MKQDPQLAVLLGLEIANMVSQTTYDVFLSHNSANKPAVEALAQRLVNVGFQPWLDTWNLVPGEPWQEAIEEALDACQAVAIEKGANLCK